MVRDMCALCVYQVGVVEVFRTAAYTARSGRQESHRESVREIIPGDLRPLAFLFPKSRLAFWVWESNLRISIAVPGYPILMLPPHVKPLDHEANNTAKSGWPDYDLSHSPTAHSGFACLRGTLLFVHGHGRLWKHKEYQQHPLSHRKFLGQLQPCHGRPGLSQLLETSCKLLLLRG